MAQYLSNAITHRCRIDAVQHVMSDESQMSHTICPSVQVWMTVYKTQMGITRMDTSRSVIAREAIRWTLVLRPRLGIFPTDAAGHQQVVQPVGNVEDHPAWQPPRKRELRLHTVRGQEVSEELTVAQLRVLQKFLQGKHI
ncbi:hypothetical protein EYF80_009485 [Liparis tanakae]|uniref:Uncharacterized protein n=1 Tax=Liparis tanakae TaxID=230148 RepID=A0A4Z2IQ85_9TELE|nr:hypothetical protein EYF80_009485 [Liparis tanakae]